MSTEPPHDLILLHNLQQIRFNRPWIDAEFTLYQKLCRNREAILDVQIIHIEIARKRARKELRESSRDTNTKTF